MRIFRKLCQMAIFLLFAQMQFLSFAQVSADRQFPPGTQRGKLDMSAYPDVRLNGKAVYLAPACRIFNAENMFVVPASLDEKEIIVNYTLNVMGDVDRIWILTRSEIGKQLPVEQVFKPVPYKNTEIK